MPEPLDRVRPLAPRVSAPVPEIDTMVWVPLALAILNVPESLTEVVVGSEPPGCRARVLPEEMVVDPV